MKHKNNQENLLLIAWVISLIAMSGSLYFSEVKQFEPCTLCWFQRIVIYPFTLLLGIALIRKDYGISFYTMILSAIGTCISTYHYFIQKVSFVSEHSVSCGRIPCTGEYINLLGFITIPFVALTAFLIILICSFLSWKQMKKHEMKI
ncbi:disulfide oxidoreductase [Peribacillus asahii]|uniref:disulfide oxidoreductase n=1 Tax=Peribacillus asahii TaxID=228899 RepID=UPI00207AE434|nr:disulfide oxidoreductase [Peribacillus asahii]USK62357.1 disulfide bond formation protein B [Peribacillus asahii]